MLQTILVCDVCSKPAVGRVLAQPLAGPNGAARPEPDTGPHGCAKHLRDIRQVVLSYIQKTRTETDNIPPPPRRSGPHRSVKESALFTAHCAEALLRYAKQQGKAPFTCMDVYRTDPTNLSKFGLMKAAKQLLKAKKLRSTGNMRDRKLYLV